ncbi:MAG: glycosyltransferase family 4 protein [Gemmatimonadetes bacterium]|nr:glycosyltransferase family 4 protein [Gemmatimonadota bacterium]
MTRVLILTHEFAPFRGGIATLADGLAAGTAAIGLEPIVFAPDYGGVHTRQDGARVYRVIRFAGSTCSMLSIDGLVRLAARIRGIIVRERPDRVHAADPQSHMALTALARVGLAPEHTCTVHGTELLRYRSESIPRLWMAGTLPRTSRVAAVSQAVADLALRNHFVDARRLVVAHPGVTNEWRDAPAADRAATRAAWAVAADDIVLFTLGRLVPAKGHLDVIHALGTVHAKLRDRTAYVVAGEGSAEYVAELERAALDARIRLVLLGPISDTKAIAACDAADVFVMLSRQTGTRLEGFGIAYIEAGARNVPSVARATGGVQEAVRDGETGLILSAGAGPADIASALQRMIEDAELRRRLGRAARAHAASFDWTGHARTVFAGPAAAPSSGH